MDLQKTLTASNSVQVNASTDSTVRPQLNIHKGFASNSTSDLNKLLENQITSVKVSQSSPIANYPIPPILASHETKDANLTSIPSTFQNKNIHSSEHQSDKPIEQIQDSESKNPNKKRDRTMAEFVLMMDQYTPIIPDLCTDYYLTQAGFDCDDYRVKRVLALATQKFVSDIATDAYQYAKMRNQAPKDRKSGKGKKVTLTMDDLSPALSEYGINVKKPDYYL